MESVCGITRPDAGKIFLEGQQITVKNPIDAMESGIVLLPEDRQKTGLILSWGLGRNVTLPVVGRLAKKDFADEAIERSLAKKFLKEVDTKGVDVGAKAEIYQNYPGHTDRLPRHCGDRSRQRHGNHSGCSFQVRSF